MKITMQNSTVESPTKERAKRTERIHYALSTQTPILGLTSQRKVKIKIEICLCDEQYHSVRMLYNDYGLPIPTWLRRKFILNQNRRKCLNDNLREAQLDKVYCGKCTNSDEWYDQLHTVWHDINRVVSCV